MWYFCCELNNRTLPCYVTYKNHCLLIIISSLMTYLLSVPATSIVSILMHPSWIVRQRCFPTLVVISCLVFTTVQLDRGLICIWLKFMGSVWCMIGCIYKGRDTRREYVLLQKIALRRVGITENCVEAWVVILGWEPERLTYINFIYPKILLQLWVHLSGCIERIFVNCISFDTFGWWSFGMSS